MDEKTAKRMTVIELAGFLREQIPPGISEAAIRMRIRRDGLKIDKMHKVDVVEVLDAHTKSKAGDNKTAQKPAGIEDGQDPKREKTILECKILREKLATIKGEQILVAEHHAELMELAGYYRTCLNQWVSEVKVLTGDAKLLSESERLRDRVLAHAQEMIDNNTHKVK